MKKPLIVVPTGRSPRAFTMPPQPRLLQPDPDAPTAPTDPTGPDDPDEISIFGEVGDYGTTADMIAAQLKNCTAPVLNLTINSGGGSVFDGLAIYNMLAAHPAKVAVSIAGWAASIASVIAMAGDEIRIAENAQLMIHSAWSFCIGSASDMRAEAGVLDNIDASILGIYVARTGGDPKAIATMVSAETWMSGQEAVDSGFCDTFVPNKTAPKPAAKMGPEFYSFAKMPEALRSGLRRQPTPAAAAARPETRVDLERLLRGQGFSKSESRKIVAGGWPALGETDPDEFNNFASTIASATADLQKIRNRKNG